MMNYYCTAMSAKLEAVFLYKTDVNVPYKSDHAKPVIFGKISGCIYELGKMCGDERTRPRVLWITYSGIRNEFPHTVALCS